MKSSRIDLSSYPTHLVYGHRHAGAAGQTLRLCDSFPIITSAFWAGDAEPCKGCADKARRNCAEREEGRLPSREVDAAHGGAQCALEARSAAAVVAQKAYSRCCKRSGEDGEEGGAGDFARGRTGEKKVGPGACPCAGRASGAGQAGGVVHRGMREG